LASVHTGQRLGDGGFLIRNMVWNGKYAPVHVDLRDTKILRKTAGVKISLV
jgi:hypothetical protein